MMNRAVPLVMLAAALPACGLFGNKKKGPPGSEPVDPVAHEKLVALLPKLDGWEARPAQGKVSKVGKDEISVASTTYEKQVDGKVSTIHLEILDGAYISSVYSPFAVMAHLQQGAAADPHKMRIDIDGNPGMEEWKPETHSVTALLLVARRFVITLKGTDIPPGTVKETLQRIDLKKLASLGG